MRCSAVGIAAALLAAAGVASAKPRAEPVNHGPRDAPRIALTFDTCSGPPPGKLDQGVVDALEAAGARATFFVGGRWAEQDPARVKRLAQNPAFEIESHTYYHRHLEELDDAALRADLVRGRDVLTPLLGHAPVYMRAPYAEADSRVVRAALAAGLTTIGYDLASGDPDPSFNTKRLTRWVLRSVKPGGIIVFHANGRGWHTAEALPGILAGLKDKGFQLVTVAELLGTGAPGAPPTADAGSAPDAGDRAIEAAPEPGAPPASGIPDGSPGGSH